MLGTTRSRAFSNASTLAPRGFRFVSSLPLIHEVTPRDGLQNEKTVLSVPSKVKTIENLISSGFRSIEVASFVRPDLVPAMANATEMLTVLANESQTYNDNKSNLSLAALVPNFKGYEAFQTNSELECVVVLTSASDSHSRANVNAPMREAFKTTCDIIRAAKQDNKKVRAYVSLAFGCPFEGDVDPDLVREFSEGYFASGADEVVLADTIGVATAEQIVDLCAGLGDDLMKTGLHLHDTHGFAKRNIAAGVLCGIRSFDAALGQCGGCNFVPNATGNASTADLVATLDVALPLDDVARSELNAIDLDKMHASTLELQEALNRPLVLGHHQDEVDKQVQQARALFI